MDKFVCIVQAGQASEAKQAELAEGLKKIGREMFADPPEGAGVRWLSIREGFGFTAGIPSTSTLVIRSVPVGFDDDEREEFLTQVSSLWKDVTGCTLNEIVVTALDGPLPL